MTIFNVQQAPNNKHIFNSLIGKKQFYLVLLFILQSSLSWAAENNSNSNDLKVAQFDREGALEKPADLDRWIHLGSNMGQGYNEELFDPSKPGTFHIVEIEPTAYDYFKNHGHYADGTMIALSFYTATDKSNPRLNGFSQDKLVSFEIHLIDGKKYQQGRAFFNFGLKEKAEQIKDASRCIKCHDEEGAFESTFTQFYPKMQKLLLLHSKK